jgi:predicted phosphodiesterase
MTLTRVKILHVSDFHIAKHLRSKDFVNDRVRDVFRGSFFKPAANYLTSALAQKVFSLRDRFDAIVITGDLSTSGRREDLIAALRYVDSSPKGGLWQNEWGEPTLQAAGKPIILMPGNHDRFDQNVGLPGGVTFDRVFSDYWKNGQGVASYVVSEFLVLLACDLTLSADEVWPLWNFWGKGKAYPRRIEELIDRTRIIQLEQPAVAVMWAVHFPPRFEGVSSFLELMDEELLVEAAQRAGVGYLLCGHTHKPNYYVIDRDLYVHCAGSATQRGRQPNTMHQLDIYIERGSIERFVCSSLTYDQARGQFIDS